MSVHGGEVFRSGDNDMNWTQVNSGLLNVDIYAIAVIDSNLFVGTYGGGVFLSTNEGELERGQ